MFKNKRYIRRDYNYTLAQSNTIKQLTYQVPTSTCITSYKLNVLHVKQQKLLLVKFY